MTGCGMAPYRDRAGRLLNAGRGVGTLGHIGSLVASPAGRAHGLDHDGGGRARAYRVKHITDGRRPYRGGTVHSSPDRLDPRHLMTPPDGLLSERFFDALGYAARLHNRQVRKGGGSP